MEDLICEWSCLSVTMAVCILCTCPFVFKPLSISDAARMCVCVCVCVCLSLFEVFLSLYVKCVYLYLSVRGWAHVYLMKSIWRFAH